ncbi:MAG: TfoX/Sxy family protein [Chloroflexi bacterium]|nr:MAG: TfoX/Sxy family protein [Chloroflexota bacterium]
MSANEGPLETRVGPSSAAWPLEHPFYRPSARQSSPAQGIAHHERANVAAVAWKRSPPELIAAFEKAKPDDPGVQSRPMFGYPSVFWNGNHFAGTFQDKIVVRIGKDPAFAPAKTAKPFEPMPGRAMTGYIVVPDAIAKSPAKLREWIGEAHDYAKTLPAKGAKPVKKPAIRKTTAKKPRR